jgi:hypothetical protein
VTGGFWSLISVVQTAGLPNLTITHNGNTVTVSWPNTGSYTLQQNANLAAGQRLGDERLFHQHRQRHEQHHHHLATGNLFFRLAHSTLTLPRIRVET